MRTYFLAVRVTLPAPLYDFCGPSKATHLKTSVHHKCCGSNHFSSLTHCCCHVGEALEIRRKDSTCCPPESGVCVYRGFNALFPSQSTHTVQMYANIWKMQHKNEGHSKHFCRVYFPLLMLFYDHGVCRVFSPKKQ